MTHLHPCDRPDCAWNGDPDAAALKADRDHLLTVLENTAHGLRLSLAGHTDAATPLRDIDAARELLRQAEAAIAGRAIGEAQR